MAAAAETTGVPLNPEDAVLIDDTLVHDVVQKVWPETEVYLQISLPPVQIL